MGSDGLVVLSCNESAELFLTDGDYFGDAQVFRDGCQFQELLLAGSSRDYKDSSMKVSQQYFDDVLAKWAMFEPLEGFYFVGEWEEVGDVLRVVGHCFEVDTHVGPVGGLNLVSHAPMPLHALSIEVEVFLWEIDAVSLILDDTDNWLLFDNLVDEV